MFRGIHLCLVPVVITFTIAYEVLSHEKEIQQLLGYVDKVINHDQEQPHDNMKSDFNRESLVPHFQYKSEASEYQETA